MRGENGTLRFLDRQNRNQRLYFSFYKYVYKYIYKYTIHSFHYPGGGGRLSFMGVAIP